MEENVDNLSQQSSTDTKTEKNQSTNQGSDEQNLSWRESLPNELKTDKTLDRFNKGGVPELAKSWIEAQKVISKKGIVVPGEKATPEEIDAFHKSLGRPDKPEGYELSKPELPEGMVYDENQTKAFATLAHKEGLTKKQLAALHDGWNEMAKTAHEANMKAVKDFREKTTGEMKKEWGKDFKSNLAQADATIDRVFGPEFKKLLVETGLNDHPGMIKGLFNVSQTIGEHALALKGTDGKGKNEMTREKLISMKMDPRYHEPGKKDPAYIKEVEKANREYAASLGAE